MSDTRPGPKAEPDFVRGGRLPLLAFVTDEVSENALRTALGAMVPGMEIRRGDVLAATRALGREEQPEALIVDIEGVSDAYGALDQLASVCTPNMRVLVVGDRNEMGFYRELTQNFGVSEYIYKPLTRINVTNLFGPHVNQNGEIPRAGSSRQGRIAAVMGARGGVGCTTVAVNLGLSLAETTQGHVAIVDMNLSGGTSALMLGVKPPTGLRLALEEPGRVDALFLDRVSVEVGTRVRLIAAEEPLDSDPAPTAEGVTRLISLLQERFNHVVIDLPRPLGPRGRQVLSAARAAVIVLTPEIGGVRDAVALRRIAETMGHGATTLTALNRDGAPGAMARELLKEGLGAEPDARIPDLPKVLPRTANLGEPAIRASNAFRKGLAPLVREIGGAQAVAAPGFLGRLFGRGTR